MTFIRAAGRLAALLIAVGLVSPVVASAAQADSGYVSTQTFRQFQAAGGGEENRPVIQGYVEWQKARFGATLPADYSRRMAAEFAKQRSTYPDLAPGAKAPYGIPSWTSIGPTEAKREQNGVTLKVTDSGRLRNILPHPTDPNIVYVLSSSGGLWKTTNFEDRNPDWIPITDKTITTSGGAAALGRNPNTLYYGTGDPFDGIPLVGGAMLKSSNGGNSWSDFVFLGNAARITDVKVDTSTATDIVLVGTDLGVFRSADGGNSYTQTLGGGQAWSVVKTSAGWLAAVATSAYYSPAYLYLSTDAGATWKAVTAPNVTAGAGRITLAVGAPGDAVVYAYAATDCAADCAEKDLYRSANGGYSWTPLGLTAKAPVNPNDENPTMNLMLGQAFYNHMIVVDPTDPARNTVYLGGQLNSAKTTDGGQSWKLITNWLAQFGLPYMHADHHTAAISIAGGKKRILFGSDGGLFVSKDEGATFTDQKNVGLVDFLIYSMATSGSDPKSVLVGLQDNGTRIRVGNTSVFNQSFGGDGFGVGWSQAKDTNALGSYVYGFIYYSDKTPNRQKRWTEPVLDDANCTYNGVKACDAFFVTPIETPSVSADPVGDTFFTATAHFIYRTDDAGASWKPIYSNSLPGTVRGATHIVAASPLDLQHVAAVSAGGFIYITADGGKTWQRRDVRVPGFDGFNSSIAWANNKVLYVASENPNGQGTYVVKSNDGGLTWAAAGKGLPGVPVGKLLVAPNDLSGNTVYAATFLGVYRTVNGGASWTQFGAGLPTVQVSDLYMPANGSFLRASTYGRGVWDIPAK